MNPQVVFITGASSGIGKATAEYYVKLGASVIINARHQDELTQIKSECKKINPNARVLPLAADVRNPEEINQAISEAVKVFGRIDVVIANAGFGVSGLIEKLTIDDFRRQFETNVFGVLNTLYASLEELKKTKGRFAITGSIYSYVSHGYLSAYCMSKHAVKALAEALYAEMKPKGVSVTLICPGIIESNIRRVDNLGNFHPDAVDPAPTWMQYSVQKTAKQIVTAVQKRKREVVISGHGKLSHFIQRHFPCLAIRLGQLSMKLLRKRHVSL
jgi:short-subunit dehydrogenase